VEWRKQTGSRQAGLCKFYILTRHQSAGTWHWHVVIIRAQAGQLISQGRLSALRLCLRVGSHKTGGLCCGLRDGTRNKKVWARKRDIYNDESCYETCESDGRAEDVLACACARRRGKSRQRRCWRVLIAFHRDGPRCYLDGGSHSGRRLLDRLDRGRRGHLGGGRRCRGGLHDGRGGISVVARA